MFDEKSSKWIQFYKYAIIISFWSLLVGGILLGIFDFTAVIDIIYDDSFGELLLWPIVGIIAAFSQLIVGMLFLQFLNNVQIIRQRIENMPIPETSKKGAGSKSATTSKNAGNSQPHPIYTVPIDGGWTCSCGKNYPPYVSSCICGKTKAEVKIEKLQNN